MQKERLFELLLVFPTDIENKQYNKIINRIGKVANIELLDNWGIKELFPRTTLWRICLYFIPFRFIRSC